MTYTKEQLQKILSDVPEQMIRLEDCGHFIFWDGATYRATGAGATVPSHWIELDEIRDELEVKP